MTWKYDPAQGTVKDQVRFWIGDTDPTDRLLEDEEIESLLTLENNRLFETAADAAGAIAARFARQATSKSVGSMSLSLARFDHFKAMADDLRAKSVLMLDGSPVVGGISIADKQSQEQEDDRVKPKFRKDSLDLPGTGSESDWRGFGGIDNDP